MNEIGPRSGALELARRSAPVRLPIAADAVFSDMSEQPGLTLASLFASAWRRRLVFLAATLVVFGIAVAIIMSLQPRYESEALLMVDPRQINITNVQTVQEGAAATLSDLNFVRSQMQILTSDELARRVVVDMKLQDDPAFAAPPTLMSRLPALVALLPGPAQRAIEPLLRPNHAPADPTEAAVARYKDLFNAFSDGKSFIIVASFSAPDPVFAQRVLNRHLALFQAGQIASKRGVITQAENWFAGELQNLHVKLVASEAQQQTFRQTSELIRAGGETVPSRQMASVTNDLSEARADLARKQARYAQLSSASRTGAADTAVLASDLVQKLREQESLVGQQVAELALNFRDSYPPLKAAKARLADVQAHISQELQRLTASAATDVAIATTNVAQTEATVAEANRKLGASSENELTATQLDRDIEVDRHLYDDLLLRSKQVSIQGQLQEPDTRIVSAATLSLSATFPRKGMLLAISAVGATLLGGLAAFLADAMKTRRAVALGEMEAACGIAGLAVIPRLHASERRRSGAPKSGTHLAAALQRLKNSIAFRCADRNAKVTVFASALPGEGKTMLATLYARSLAAEGTRVLLIDADLRRSGLTRLTGAGAAKGLSDCLAGRPLNTCVVADQVAGLDILPAGESRSEPGALLTTDRVAQLLAAASKTYAAIVIDTPPVAVVDDALHLIAQADATVMVARWNRTPLAAIRKALGRTALTGGNVVGVVLTATDMRKYRSGADTPISFAQQKSYYITAS